MNWSIVRLIVLTSLAVACLFGRPASRPKPTPPPDPRIATLTAQVADLRNRLSEAETVSAARREPAQPGAETPENRPDLDVSALPESNSERRPMPAVPAQPQRPIAAPAPVYRPLVRAPVNYQNCAGGNCGTVRRGLFGRRR